MSRSRGNWECLCHVPPIECVLFNAVCMKLGLGLVFSQRSYSFYPIISLVINMN